MRNKGLVIIISLVVILIALKLLFFPGGKQANQAGPQKKGEESVLTDGFIVTKDTGSLDYSTSGDLLAAEESELRPEVSGKLISIYFKEGERVEKGKLLAKVQDAELRANLEKARLELKLAEQRRDRQQKLLKVEGVSKEEYEASEAAVNAQKAQIDAIAAQIERTEIRAPFSGTVGLKAVSEGSFVTPSTRIAGIKLLDSLKLDFSLPARYSRLVSSGTIVEFTDESGMAYQARINAMEPGISGSTRTLNIRAHVKNKDGKLIPGSFVTVRIPMQDKQGMIFIPAEAIVPAVKGKKVYVAKAGRAEEREVITGERNEKNILIEKGLNVGDTLLTSGLLSLRPGVKLKYRRVR